MSDTVHVATGSGLDQLSRPTSLTELARLSLRDAIIDGRLKLGDQLSESRLSKMLGISKTPVREALLQLKREGLVQIDPRKGTSIFRIDSAEVGQICDFREILELAAAARVFAGDREPVARRMNAIVAEMAAVLKGETFARYQRLDADLHAALIEGAGNPYISDAYGLIASKVGALRTRAQSDASVVQSSLRTHAELARWLADGQEREFSDLLRNHIRNTGRDYKAWLARDGAEAQGPED